MTEGARLASKELWKKAGKNEGGEEESSAAGEEIAARQRNSRPHPAGSTSSARKPPIGAVPRLSAPP